MRIITARAVLPKAVPWLVAGDMAEDARSWSTLPMPVALWLWGDETVMGFRGPQAVGTPRIGLSGLATVTQAIVVWCAPCAVGSLDLADEIIDSM